MGRFFFTPGCLTPSLFNDDSLFEVLKTAALPKRILRITLSPAARSRSLWERTREHHQQLAQPGKILELTLHNGVSAITGTRIGKEDSLGSAAERLGKLRELFYENVEFYAARMAEAANKASRALSLLPVPF
jgi:formate C-acetyltransferase